VVVVLVGSAVAILQQLILIALPLYSVRGHAGLTSDQAIDSPIVRSALFTERP
jgi:hypothetical protein